MAVIYSGVSHTGINSHNSGIRHMVTFSPSQHILPYSTQPNGRFLYSSCMYLGMGFHFPYYMHSLHLNTIMQWESTTTLQTLFRKSIKQRKQKVIIFKLLDRLPESQPVISVAAYDKCTYNREIYSNIINKHTKKKKQKYVQPHSSVQSSSLHIEVFPYWKTVL